MVLFTFKLKDENKPIQNIMITDLFELSILVIFSHTKNAKIAAFYYYSTNRVFEITIVMYKNWITTCILLLCRKYLYRRRRTNWLTLFHISNASLQIHVFNILYEIFADSITFFIRTRFVLTFFQHLWILRCNSSSALAFFIPISLWYMHVWKYRYACKC